MIDFIKTWANQIIVAVIIATIFEMILPNGNNKKYIKMIIGLYILFNIVQPITSKITGKSIEISNFDFTKYYKDNTFETTAGKFKNNNSKLIEQAYINNIKQDIKNKIEQKGYFVISCKISILNDESKSTYGEIKSIYIDINKNKESKTASNEIHIQDVQINANNNVRNMQDSSIKDEEKIEIIEYLSTEYFVDKKNIVIN